MKTFEEWYNASEWREGDNAVLVADDAWNYQEKRIKKLENSWISVDERLPEEEKRVYLTLVSNNPDAGISWFEDGSWMGHHVTHWMPRPENKQ